MIAGKNWDGFYYGFASAGNWITGYRDPKYNSFSQKLDQTNSDYLDLHYGSSSVAKDRFYACAFGYPIYFYDNYSYFSLATVIGE